MNHLEFIEKNVKELLIKQGFSSSVAQGGHGKRLIYISVCRKPARKEQFSMMSCGMRKLGLTSRLPKLKSRNENAPPQKTKAASFKL